LIALLVNGHSHIELNSIPEYLALAPAEPDVKQNPRIQPLIKLYNQFKKEASLSDRITEIYAEKFYFNDTIVTLHERRDLANCFKNLLQQDNVTVRGAPLTELKRSHRPLIKTKLQNRQRAAHPFDRLVRPDSNRQSQTAATLKAVVDCVSANLSYGLIYLSSRRQRTR
jgi:hypothetical protein